MIYDMRVILVSLLFPFVFLSLNASAQEGAVQLKVINIKLEGKELLFNVQVVNNSGALIKIYKPGISDICNSLLRIKFVSLNEESRIHFVNPCTEVVDLDTIILKDENSIFLDSGEYLGKVFPFSVEDISPFLKEGSYKVQIELNYSNAEFEGETDNLFKSKLISQSTFIFSYERH
jgi:hypothetical protein